MALPWPHGLPTMPVPTVRVAPAAPATRRTRPELERLRAIALAPVTTLVAMLAGLVLLFAVPLVGLPFVALVVLPAVIFQLRAERRPYLRTRR